MVDRLTPQTTGFSWPERLLCDSGVDLDRLNELRDGLDHLLGQIKALS